MHRTRWMLAFGLLVAALTFAACGGGDDNSSSGGGSEATATATATQASDDSSGGGGGATVDISAPADGSLKFDKADLTAKAGKTTIDFDNPSSVPHAVEIEGNGLEEKATKTVTKGKSSITVELKPGKYEFYCPVDGHKAAGMEGTITVS
jgi:plastocyanin